MLWTMRFVSFHTFCFFYIVRAETELCRKSKRYEKIQNAEGVQMRERGERAAVVEIKHSPNGGGAIRGTGAKKLEFDNRCI